MTRPTVIRIAVLLVAAGIVEALCRTGVIANLTMIPPSAMVTGLVDIVRSGRFNLDIAVTLRNVAIAIVAAMLTGPALAILLNRLPAVRRILDPLFATYYAIPVYAFYPLLMVVLGLGDAPQIAVGFLLAVVAVLINTLNGLDRMPAVLLKVARMHRMSTPETALKIRLPFAAPYVFTGFKLAVAYAFVGVVGAEFITSSRGIGYEISYAYNNFDNAVMYPLILLILVIAIVVNMSLYAWERRLVARRKGEA
jgi:NitT/TauT family transport system permease protein